MSKEIENRNKLFNFWDLDEQEFFKQLKLKIGKINVKDFGIIKNEFNITTNKINELNNRIKKINQHLNHTIYGIYGLNDNEINLIENNSS